jgi:hypothetical protein
LRGELAAADLPQSKTAAATAAAALEAAARTARPSKSRAGAQEGSGSRKREGRIKRTRFTAVK